MLIQDFKIATFHINKHKSIYCVAKLSPPNPKLAQKITPKNQAGQRTASPLYFKDDFVLKSSLWSSSTISCSPSSPITFHSSSLQNLSLLPKKHKWSCRLAPVLGFLLSISSPSSLYQHSPMTRSTPNPFSSSNNLSPTPPCSTTGKNPCLTHCARGKSLIGPGACVIMVLS